MPDPGAPPWLAGWVQTDGISGSGGRPTGSIWAASRLAGRALAAYSDGFSASRYAHRPPQIVLRDAVITLRPYTDPTGLCDR